MTNTTLDEKDMDEDQFVEVLALLILNLAEEFSRLSNEVYDHCNDYSQPISKFSGGTCFIETELNCSDFRNFAAEFAGRIAANNLPWVQVTALLTKRKSEHKAREAALAKLTLEEKRLLGLAD
jgi:hypothetical protein